MPGQSRCVATGLSFLYSSSRALSFNYFIIKARCQALLQSFSLQSSGFANGFIRLFCDILGCSQVGKAPDFDSGKTLSPVGSSPTTPAKQRLSSPLVVNNIKLATIESLYPFFFAIVVDGEFQVVFYGVFV